MKKILTIPEFKSIQEEAEFWDTHDSEDYQWEKVTDIKFSKNLTSVFVGTVALKVDQKTADAVQKVARQKKMGVSDTVRMLIRERLSQLKVI